jgi:PAS domain S-box-containing protein
VHGATSAELARLAAAVAEGAGAPAIELLPWPDNGPAPGSSPAAVALVLVRPAAIAAPTELPFPLARNSAPTVVLLTEGDPVPLLRDALKSGAVDCLSWDAIGHGGLARALRMAPLRAIATPGGTPPPGSQEIYRTLVEQSQVMIWMDDRNREGVYANQAIQEFTGVSMEAIVGGNWVELLHPDDRARVHRQYTIDRDARVPFTSEYRFRRHDGAWRWVMEFGAPRFESDGSFAGYIGSLVEVNDSHETADALRESEARYRSVVSALQEGITVLGRDSEILTCNESACRILGLTVEQMTGRTALDPRWRAIHPDGRPFPGETHPVVVTLRTGLACTGVIMGIHKPDESLTWIRINSKPLIRPGEDLPYAAVCSFTDISDALQAERALTEMGERYRAFVAQSTEGIFRAEFGEPVPLHLPPEQQLALILESGRIAECNLAFARLHGAESVEAVLGRSLPSIVAADDPRHREFWLDLVRSGYRLVEAESMSQTPGGPARHFLNNLLGFVEQGRLVRLWGVQRDISERKALEEQLRQSQKMEGIGRLAGGVAHDFNNLLTAIIGGAELVLEREDLHQTAREDVEEIRRAARRAANLTQQLLAFSRRQVLKPKLLDVNEVVRHADRMLRRLLGEHVQLENTFARISGAVRADPGQLEQVIVNLLVNARDAMPQGGTIRLVTSTIEVTSASAAEWPGLLPGRYVLLTVRDHGEGMTPETLLHLFEPFYTTKAPGKGTGLGLATVYGIVKQTGGFIYAESRLGHGSQFHVYLPLIEGAEPEGLDAPLEAPSLRAATGTVLLVEDEPMVRRLSRRVLEGRGYQVLEAGNGTEALQLAGNWRGTIDILVTDLVMPGLSGQALAEVLKQARPTVRIIYMSGYTPDVIVQHGDLPPGAIFLPKPFSPSSLLAALDDVLALAGGHAVRNTPEESSSSRSK